jgi:hypothetical protein
MDIGADCLFDELSKSAVGKIQYVSGFHFEEFLEDTPIR